MQNIFHLIFLRSVSWSCVSTIQINQNYAFLYLDLTILNGELQKTCIFAETWLNNFIESFSHVSYRKYKLMIAIEKICNNNNKKSIHGTIIRKQSIRRNMFYFFSLYSKSIWSFISKLDTKTLCMSVYDCACVCSCIFLSFMLYASFQNHGIKFVAFQISYNFLHTHLAFFQISNFVFDNQ